MGGGAAYRKASLVSAVMLARIGPVKPFLLKYLIAHSRGMRPNRRHRPRAAAELAKQGMRRVVGDAQVRERGQRGDRRRHSPD